MPKTIKEIAQDTGYSRTTVTLVINGKADEYRISPKARAVIENYIAEHGYRYNQAARSLKLARSNTIALIVPDIANAFFARVTAELERLCRAEGLVLVTTSSGENPLVERQALENFVARGIDGIVLTPCEPRRRLPSSSSRPGPPVVLIDRRFDGDEGYFISSNHFESAQTLTRAMIEGGAGDISFLTGSQSNPTTLQRISGFRDAISDQPDAARHFAVRSIDTDTEEGGRRLMGDLLDSGTGLTSGLIFGSLLIFNGAMREIRARYGAIPTDLMAGTFAYSEVLDYMPNPVYVVRQNERAIARHAFESLLCLMQKQPLAPSHIFVATELLHFGSHQSVTE
jgi:DNA-binding LacI/PurR family transcriptional regulator